MMRNLVSFTSSFQMEGRYIIGLRSLDLLATLATTLDICNVVRPAFFPTFIALSRRVSQSVDRQARPEGGENERLEMYFK